MPGRVDKTIELTEDETDDLLYLARVGEGLDLATSIHNLSDLKSVATDVVARSAVDPHTGNTCMHYACANGHSDVVLHLSTLNVANMDKPDPIELVLSKNDSGNTPLHYAALNGHLETIKILLSLFDRNRFSALIQSREERASAESEQARQRYRKMKADYIGRKNDAGHDAAYEAETSGKEEVVNFLLGIMDELDDEKEDDVEEGGGDAANDEEQEQEISVSVGEEESEHTIAIERDIGDMKLEERT